MVNVVFLGQRLTGAGAWVPVVAGLPGTAVMIRRAAETRFGDVGPR